MFKVAILFSLFVGANAAEPSAVESSPVSVHQEGIDKADSRLLETATSVTLFDQDNRMLSPTIECLGIESGWFAGTSPPSDSATGYPYSGYSVAADQCAGVSGGDYFCNSSNDQCDLYCRYNYGTSKGPWSKITINKQIVPGSFIQQTCPAPVCVNPRQFCTGSWEGQSNCGSMTPEELTDSCNGSISNSVGWELSIEVQSTVEVEIPFCASGKTTVKVGGKRNGSETFTKPLRCNPGMLLPGCHKCGPGDCRYICRVAKVSHKSSAPLHYKYTVYWGAHTMEEKTCSWSAGTLRLDMVEWDQPAGCTLIIDDNRECDADEKYGECAPTTTTISTTFTSTTTAGTSSTPVTSSSTYYTSSTNDATSSTSATSGTSSTPGTSSTSSTPDYTATTSSAATTSSTPGTSSTSSIYHTSSTPDYYTSSTYDSTSSTTPYYVRKKRAT